jgi:hypothetical protein
MEKLISIQDHVQKKILQLFYKTKKPRLEQQKVLKSFDDENINTNLITLLSIPPFW